MLEAESIKMCITEREREIKGERETERDDVSLKRPSKKLGMWY